MKYAYDVACVAAIEDGKVLLVKKRDFWIFPGGQIERGEGALRCITRELSEELPESSLQGDLIFFDEFPGFTPSGTYIRAFCFLGKIKGPLTPAAEISDAKWISKKEIFSFYKFSLAEITTKIFVRLLSEKLI